MMLTTETSRPLALQQAWTHCHATLFLLLQGVQAQE